MNIRTREEDEEEEEEEEAPVDDDVEAPAAVGELLPDEEVLLFLLMNWKSIASVG